MSVPTFQQTADGLEATVTEMKKDPRLNADAAARLAIHGNADWQLPYDDTTDSLLYEAVTDEIAFQHSPDLDADERGTAQEIPRDEALRCAREGVARFRSIH